MKRLLLSRRGLGNKRSVVRLPLVLALSCWLLTRAQLSAQTPAPNTPIEVFDFLSGDKNEPAPAVTGGGISDAGRRLAKKLDAMDVKHLWLAKHYVNWETGVALDRPVQDKKPLDINWLESPIHLSGGLL